MDTDLTDDPETLLLAGMYDAFNARRLDELLGAMHADVDWPNGWEGGRLVGHAAVSDYWTRQWTAIDPNVAPIDFRREPDGRVAVSVRQVVRDPAGAILDDRMVEQIYRFESGLVRSMDIRNGL